MPVLQAFPLVVEAALLFTRCRFLESADAAEDDLRVAGGEGSPGKATALAVPASAHGALIDIPVFAGQQLGLCA